MLHSEFCAVCSSLSDVSAKIILLINIHEWSRATVRSRILMSKILFCWNIWQRRTNSTKLAVKHHNVRLHIHSDSWQNLHSARCAQSQERCSNFSHKITRCVVLASLWKASYFKPAMSSSDWNSLVWLPFLNCKLSSINGESALMSRMQSFTKSSVARIFIQNCFNPSVSTRSTSRY